MSAEAAFVQRSKAVTAYLRSLRDLEQKHRTPGRGFYRAAAAITASRAATFIMMYNCVEFGLRLSASQIRRDIISNGHTFVELRAYWREEITSAKFHDKLKQGTNHKQLVRSFSAFVPGDVDWGAALEKVPSAGNVDNVRILEFIRRIEHRWRPPPSTLGGSDLDLIRRMRNDLAHGEEEFESVGSVFDTADLAEKYKRVRVFMVSLIRTLDRYKNEKRYLA